MSRKKGSPNKNWQYITYPRECEECGHLSNNPGTYSYHQRKHESIPAGILCDGGCGKPAKFKNTNNKYRCKENWAHCSQYLDEQSDRVTSIWEERHKLFASVHENSAPKEKRAYNRLVDRLTKYNYKKYILQINPLNLQIGTHQYHIDHKVSKYVGWALRIPAKYIANATNLEVLHWEENMSKFYRCSMHPTELLERCDASEDDITQIERVLVQPSNLIEPLLITRRQTSATS